MELVPVSVLLQTLSTAAAKSGASILSDVRFEYPVVVDQPRVIQVIADDQSVTLSSSPAADTPSHRWIRHATARISQRPDYDEPEGTDVNGDHEPAGFDASSVAELQRAWGIEGSRSPGRSAPAARGRVDCTRTSAAGGVDGRTARRRRSRRPPGRQLDPRLMFPAGVESVRLTAGLADARGSVEVRRRGGNGDELIVDIAVKAPDGSTCIDIRGFVTQTWSQVLRMSAPRDADPHTIGTRDRVATVGASMLNRNSRLMPPARSRFSGRAMPRALCAIGSPTPVTRRPASARHGMSST